MKKTMCVLGALVILVAACQSTTTPEESTTTPETTAPTPGRMTPEEVVMAQVEPWNAGDVETAMNLYADDVVVKIEPALPPGSPNRHSGKDEVRAWFEELVAMNFALQLEVLRVDGNTVTTETKTWVDATRELGLAPLVATEVYTVQDGRIKGWSWTLSDESLAKVQAASAPSETAEAWDLLYIQDSTGFGVASRYAERAEQALGVEVNVHDKATGNLRAVDVLGRLRGEHSSDWPDLVREAEIIVFWANPRQSGCTSDMEICISASKLEREPPVHYAEEDWQPYRDVLDEIYAEIWKLRDGRPVVLLAVDFYNPAISDWQAAGIEPECTAALEALNRTVREAAEANGATTMSIYDLFNGRDHQEDPREKGYIGSDGLHASVEGKAAIADALAAVGFEPAMSPHAEEIQVKVAFDGETCSYEGPAAISVGTVATFELQATADADPVALIVGRVEEGTTWEEIVEYNSTHSAGYPPPYAEPGYRLRTSPGLLVVPLGQAGDYAVLCATAPQGTNTAYPAALLEVVES